MSIVYQAEVRGGLASAAIDPISRSALGQFMTPIPVARFMASLFSDTSEPVRLLDPGAGVGTLTAAFVEKICSQSVKPSSVSLECQELARELIGHLGNTLNESAQQLEAAQIRPSSTVNWADFILGNSNGRPGDLFESGAGERELFTHVIMNPPYRKIHSGSEYRIAIRKAGLETSNLYTGFMFLAAQRLRNGGEMVAIVPRSFCNGLYFEAFRKQFFSVMTLRHIHIFQRRDSAFRGAGVLQENIIIHAVKGLKPAKVKITASNGAGAELYSPSERIIDYSAVIHPNDPHKFVHIVTDEQDQDAAQVMSQLTATLFDIGLEVSTGPIVDFRAKPLLLSELSGDAAPLLYPAHFRGGRLEWPKEMKKPNAIQVTERSRKHLWANRGCYVVTKRFSAKEEKRRIVASVYRSDLPGQLIGFENHLNVYHVNRHGFSDNLATGLSIYLNSGLVDRYFRQFNGHTQVNATDLRSLRYPERDVLERIGKSYLGQELSQHRIDSIVDSELGI